MKSLKRLTRKEMIDFLSSHFRYNTMNSWNGCTSYARNVKIHNLKFPSREVEGRAYDLLGVGGAFDDVYLVLRDFAENHNYNWQIAFNGRSSGYLVLFQGYMKKSEYKTTCLSCGQKNYKEDTKVCGRCNSKKMVPYEGIETGMYGGRSTDQCVNFSEWDTSTLRDRVKLVREFDQACENAVNAFINFCKEHTVADKVINVPKTIRVAVPIGK